MRLDGKVAFITGAARGIGRRIACSMAAEGADVVLLDIAADLPGGPYPLGTAAQLRTTADWCARYGVATMCHQVDVRDNRGLGEAVSATLDRFGAIDVLVNNAGLAGPAGRPVHEMSEEEWQLILDVDLNGAWRTIRHVAPSMLRRRAGSIVNISSTAGLVGYRNFAGYVAAKHGLVGLSRAAALDFAPRGVRVNAVCPGSVQDDAELEGRMLSEIARCLEIPVATHEQTFVTDQPMNRLVTAEDVAAACLWLASDEASNVTGGVITVDGGFTAR